MRKLCTNCFCIYSILSVQSTHLTVYMYNLTWINSKKSIISRDEYLLTRIHKNGDNSVDLGNRSKHFTTE